MTDRELEMIRLYRSGVYQTQICKLLHCKRETLLKALHKGGERVLTKSERNLKTSLLKRV